MKKYKIQIIQISLLTILIFIYYMSTLNLSYNLSDATLYNSDITIKYGTNPNSFISSKTSNSTLYNTNSSLELLNKTSIKTSVLGDTISSGESGITYHNNFEEIAAVDKGKTKIYETTLEESVLDLIYERQITVSNVYADKNYYHSVSKVKLESTINYSIDASVVTQIKNGKRIDVLVYQDVLAMSYDKVQDEYYIFYSSSSSSNSISNYNDLICSKLVWNEKEKTYEADGSQVNQGIKLSSHGVFYISPIISENPYIAYSKEIALSDKRILNLYLADFNTTDLKIEDNFIFTSKEVYNDSTLDIENTFVLNNKLYIFFSNLNYTVVNLENDSTEEYIVSNTGKIKSISYTHSNNELYILFTTDKDVSLAKLDKGILTDIVTQRKSELQMGFFDYNNVYDFNVNINAGNKNKKNK